jgi:hypothetical protein
MAYAMPTILPAPDLDWELLRREGLTGALTKLEAAQPIRPETISLVRSIRRGQLQETYTHAKSLVANAISGAMTTDVSLDKLEAAWYVFALAAAAIEAACNLIDDQYVARESGRVWPGEAPLNAVERPGE